MTPVAIFYHTLFNGVHRPINSAFVVHLMNEQMRTIESVGLVDYAKEMWVGVNGDDDDAALAKALAPEKARVVAHGAGTTTEITTLRLLRTWALSNPNWAVLYFHSKGCSHPENPNTEWRLNMEKHALHNWRMCVFSLDSGHEAVGCYWLTPEAHPGLVQKHPFYGGNMWWSTSNYIARLPNLPEPTFENRYEAESWIGMGKPRPRIVNLIQGWPPQ